MSEVIAMPARRIFLIKTLGMFCMHYADLTAAEEHLKYLTRYLEDVIGVNTNSYNGEGENITIARY